MKTLTHATVVLLAGLSLAACESSMHDEAMHDDKMMEEGEHMDKAMSDEKMMSEDDKMISKDDTMMSDDAKMSMASAEMMMPAGLMTETSPMGEVLTDKMGMTLYTFDRDHPGMSVCYDNCATNWPPLMASASAKATGDFTVIERKDGTMQWALKGMPLYTWIKDSKPGDVTGDGVGGVWHAAMPSSDKMMK